MLHRAVATSSALALALASAPCFASPATPADPEAPADDAATTFDRAEALYDEGRYDEAAQLLRELVREHPDPILRYNLGRAYESSGEIAAAIDAYEQYLAAAPHAEDRPDVERRIDRLRARLPPPEPAPPPVVKPPPPRPLVAPWVLAALGGAGLVVGGTLGGLALARKSDAEDAPIQADAEAHLDDARRFATGANVAFAIGGALAIAGLAWGITALVKRKRARTRHAFVGSWNVVSSTR